MVNEGDRPVRLIWNVKKERTCPISDDSTHVRGNQSLFHDGLALAGGAAFVAALGGGAAVITRGFVTAQEGTPADADASPSPEASPEGSPSPMAGDVTIEMGDIFSNRQN